jgi:hypothetical protein
VQSILKARDLHIVDVFDMDRSGRPSKIYGRVYYENRRILLFYAFDLDRSEQTRLLVAFQARGFLQSNSSTTESLGLFYLEDPKVGHWTLRVSDPHLRKRIDTLFVTVEPPGNSKMPHGRQLLSASLGTA